MDWIRNWRGQFLGPAAELIAWMEDPEVTDILIQGTTRLHIDKSGELLELPNPFSNLADLQSFIERMILPLGKRIDATQPYLDGRLLDGSRFHLILAPIALLGPEISIRKFQKNSALTLKAFTDSQTLEWLLDFIHQKKNLLVVGGTGVGKTTLLSLLLNQLPPKERLLIVEEVHEIQISTPHSVFLEARAAGPEGRGEVTLRTLIKQALRMRPDRLVLGECRGEEVFDLIQALNTGHSGAISTLHANSSRDALRRLESLLMLCLPQANVRAVRSWIAHAIHGVVCLKRHQNQRSVAEVIEILGMEGENIRFLPILEGPQAMG